MPKKIPLLKLVVPLLTLLVFGMTGFSGNLFVAKAISTDSCQLVWSNSGSTQLDASKVTDSGLKTTLQGHYTLNCNPQYASCQLRQGSGHPSLDLTNIQTASPWLYAKLQDHYHLKCQGTVRNTVLQTQNEPSAGSCQLAWINGGDGNTDLKTDQITNQGLANTLKDYNLNCADQPTSCELVLGSGDTTLDLTNIQDQSPWIDTNLQGYNLNCNSTTDSTNNGPSNGSCVLVYGTSGNTQLDTSEIANQGLANTLQGQYTLNCNPPSNGSCVLVLGSGDTKLDLTNIQTASPWIDTNLQGYNLNCNNN
jgi:hypothetical protein